MKGFFGDLFDLNRDGKLNYLEWMMDCETFFQMYDDDEVEEQYDEEWDIEDDADEEWDDDFEDAMDEEWDDDIEDDAY